MTKRTKLATSVGDVVFFSLMMTMSHKIPTAVTPIKPAMRFEKPSLMLDIILPLFLASVVGIVKGPFCCVLSDQSFSFSFLDTDFVFFFEVVLSVHREVITAIFTFIVGC